MILRKLRANGWITTEEFRAAQGENTLSHVVPLTRKIEAPHFVFAVLEELEAKYGKDTLETGGLHVYTTLDWDAQQKAEQFVREGAEKNLAWNASNAALVALDAEKGEILAMVGSKDYFNKAIDGQVNVALAPRQPGSSFKPLVYARAFEKGYQPETILYDLPTSFGPDGSGQDYRPENYDHRYRGAVSMRQALAGSLNIPAVKTQYLAGIDSTLDQIKKMGITSATDRSRYGLSLVLGGAEVSLLQMTQAYGVFSQDGRFVPATGVLRIEDGDGRIISEPKKAEPARVLSSETARKIESILSDNQARSPVFGSRSPLAYPEGGVAAKTGTTQEFRDAWTLGFTKRVAVGVWVGNNDNTPMRAGADGVFVAAPIWRSMMDYLLTRFPREPFPDYIHVQSDHPLLTGKRVYTPLTYDKPATTKDEAEDRKKAEEENRQGLHSILYYVNRDDPLSNKPPDRSDPMLARFEAALHHPPEPEDPDKDKGKDEDKK
jgi:membrane peptidoglycan carboxypeptidase